MNYNIIPVTNFFQNCSVIWDAKKSNQAAIIDPGGEAEKIIKFLSKHQLIPSQILLTHGHLDHVGAASKLATYYNIPVIGPHIFDEFLLDNLPAQSRMFRLPECLPLVPDRWLKEGDIIHVGTFILKVIHCPGHTPGHIVFFNDASCFLISGDVIFHGGIGRTDLPQGNLNMLIHNIKTKLIPLGDDITFLPGHGTISTLGSERIENLFLQ